jgi:hypothetical protein
MSCMKQTNWTFLQVLVAHVAFATCIHSFSASVIVEALQLRPLPEVCSY